MAIAELAQDLLDKIDTVDALGHRIGMLAGAGISDPQMITAPTPSAWVLFEGESIISSDQYAGSLAEDNLLLFTCIMIIDYTSQTDLLSVQLPTLEAVVRAISGKESTNFALRWKYLGQQLVNLAVEDKKALYELKFAVSASYLN